MMDIIKELQDAFNDGYRRIMQDRWIPVSERLPERSGYYLVTKYAPIEEETVDLIEFCRVENKWNSGYPIVIAWQPLPEPWKEGANVQING